MQKKHIRCTIHVAYMYQKLIGSNPSIDDKKLRVINQLANKKPIRGSHQTHIN